MSFLGLDRGGGEGIWIGILFFVARGFLVFGEEEGKGVLRLPSSFLSCF